MSTKLVAIDFDSPIYKCGHAATKKLWTALVKDDNGVSVLFKADGKTAMNAWLKAQGYHPTQDFDKITKEINGILTVVGYTEKGGGIELVCDTVVEPLEYMLHSLKKQITKCIKATDAEEYKCYLSKGETFRHKLVDYYKANRDPASKPLYFNEMREYVQKNHPTQMCEVIEADDAVVLDHYYAYKQAGMEPSPDEEDIVCVIAHIDKDIDQVVGWHYNPDREDLYYIDEITAWRNFYIQLLAGDTSDNVPGLPRVGVPTAEKFLSDCTTQQEMYDVVKAKYLEKLKDQGLTKMDEYAKLLWMLRHPDPDHERNQVWRCE